MDHSFKEFVLDQLRGLSGLRVRAMFGGHGLYQDGTFFGILFEGRLYFKTDSRSRRDYIALGMEPFRYEQRGRRMTMQYHEVPARVLESPHELVAWAMRAVQAAGARPPRASRKRR